MTDQVENKEETIFTEEKKPDQKATSDQEVKTVENKPAPDLESIFQEQLSAIVDDKGEQKYKDPFTALEALKYTQQHVRTLEEENKSYRDKLTQDNTLEEALNRMSATQEPEPTRSEGIDAEKVRSVAMETIQQLEKDKAEAANKKAVSDALVQKYGDKEKAKQAYIDKAEELGIDVDTLVSLSAKSPKAALSYFEASQTNTPNPTRGNINPSALREEKEEVDYTSRYFTSTSPETSKWRAAGDSLIK